MKNQFIWPRSIRGFTLTETITTLSAACILLAIGIPSFQTLAQSNRMTAAINNIMAHLNLARSEAVKRGIDVVLCPSSDGADCTKTISWEDGFIMFVDEDNSRQRETDEELLRYVNLTYDSISISTTVGRKKTVYYPTGFTMGYNLTFTFCDMNEKIDPKAVIVSNTGRARLSSTKSDGSSLDCSYN